MPKKKEEVKKEPYIYTEDDFYGFALGFEPGSPELKEYQFGKVIQLPRVTCVSCNRIVEDETPYCDFCGKHQEWPRLFRVVGRRLIGRGFLGRKIIVQVGLRPHYEEYFTDMDNHGHKYIPKQQLPKDYFKDNQFK